MSIERRWTIWTGRDGNLWAAGPEKPTEPTEVVPASDYAAQAKVERLEAALREIAKGAEFHSCARKARAALKGGKP